MKDDLFAELMRSALEALEHARGSRRKFEHMLKKVRPERALDTGERRAARTRTG